MTTPKTPRRSKDRERQAVLTNSGLEEPRPSDIVIPIMGQTKSGKSTLINKLIGSLVAEQMLMKVEHRMASCTSEIRVAVVSQVPQEYESREALNEALRDRRIVFVDTPGFDDTHMMDDEVLMSISKWLEISYRRGMLVGGILYLHDINQCAWTGTAGRNLRLFDKLCGDDAMSQVCFLTTKWDKLKKIEEGTGRARELESDYWSTMVHRGASVCRLHSFDVPIRDPQAEETQSSPWDLILNLVVSMNARDVAHRILLIQKELVDRRLFLAECEAGKELRLSLKDFLKHAKLLQNQAKEFSQSDPNAKKRLLERQQEVESLARQLNTLRPTLSRRLKRWVRERLSWVDEPHNAVSEAILTPATQ